MGSPIPGRAGRDPHTEALITAAPGVGLTVRDVSQLHPPDGIELTAADGRSFVVRKGRVFPWLGVRAERTLDDKDATKRLLTKLGIPTPAGVVFADSTTVAFPARGPQVCKPVHGTHGQGVRLGLTSLAELRAHCIEHPAPAWILEDQIAGADLRIQALRGRLVAACVRRPAQVIGDGASDLRQLMAALDARVQAANPANRCLPDADTAYTLSAVGRTLDHVPASGEVVSVKSVANLAAGATAIDRTDSVHSRWGEWTERLCVALNLPFLAIDAVTPDPAADPLAPATGAFVLEANARPEWLHHTFSERRTHDLPRQILLAALSGWPSER